MSIVHTTRHIFRVGAVVGVAPYWPSDGHLRKSRVAELISCLNFFLTHVIQLFESLIIINMLVNDLETKPNGFFLIYFLTSTITTVLSSMNPLFALIHRRTMIHDVNNVSSILKKFLKSEKFQRQIVYVVTFFSMVNMGTISFMGNIQITNLNILPPITTISASLLFLIYVQMAGFGFQRINQALQSRTVDSKLIKKMARMENSLEDFILSVNLSFGPIMYLYTTMTVMSMLCLESYAVDISNGNSATIELFVHCLGLIAYFIFIVYQCNIVTSEVKLTFDT